MRGEKKRERERKERIKIKFITFTKFIKQIRYKYIIVGFNF